MVLCIANKIQTLKFVFLTWQNFNRYKNSSKVRHTAACAVREAVGSSAPAAPWRTVTAGGHFHSPRRLSLMAIFNWYWWLGWRVALTDPWMDNIPHHYNSTAPLIHAPETLGMIVYQEFCGKALTKDALTKIWLFLLSFWLIFSMQLVFNKLEYVFR